MKRRVLLAVLVCFSLILGVMIHGRGDTDRQMQQVLAELDRLPKSERDLFNSNAIDFYKHTSKAAREERKRLRSLHQQVQNDPECERLTKTMEQYVNWIKQVDDPVAMRMLQGYTIEGRVEAIKLAVHGEHQSNTTEMFTTERLREHLLEDLPPELKDFSFPALYGEFDLWLTKKYDEEKTKLTPKQLEHLPVFETFYGNLFRSWRGDTSPSETLDVPGKLAMLQLIQNLSSEPRLGGGGGFGRFGRISMVSFWRDAFFDQQKTALDNGEPNMFDQIEDKDLRRFLLQMPQVVRNDALQRLLALAILKQYPKFTVNIFGFFGFADPNRINLELGLDAKRSIDLLGTYLSIMETRRRDDFLKMNPHHANVRLQAELWGNAMALADLTRPTSERFGGGRPGGGPGGGQGGGQGGRLGGGQGGGLGGQGGGQGGRLGGGQGGGPGGPGGETPGGPPPDGRREGGPRNMPPETRPRDDRANRPGRSNRPQNEPATPQTRRNDPPIKGGA